MNTASEQKRRTTVATLWVAPLIMIMAFWLLEALSTEKMRLQDVEKRAQQLAGPESTFCGHSPFNNRSGSKAQAKREDALRRKINGCEVAAYRAGKPFYSISDSDMAGLMTSALRTVTLLTPQGKLMQLECKTTRQTRPQDQVKLRQSECSNPRVYKLFKTSLYENIGCD